MADKDSGICPSDWHDIDTEGSIVDLDRCSVCGDNYKTKDFSGGTNDEDFGVVDFTDPDQVLDAVLAQVEDLSRADAVAVLRSALRIMISKS